MTQILNRFPKHLQVHAQIFSLISLVILLFYGLLPISDIQAIAPEMPVHLGIYVVLIGLSIAGLISGQTIAKYVLKIPPALFIVLTATLFSFYVSLMFAACAKYSTIINMPWVIWSLVSVIWLVGLYLEHKKQAGHSVTIPFSWVATIVMVLLVIWLLDIQFFIPDRFFRIFAAAILSIIPGMLLQQILYSNKPFSLTRTITLGFVFSILLASLLFLVAIQLQTNISFVSNSLKLLSVLFAAIMLWQVRKTPIQLEITTFRVQDAILLFGFVVTLIIMFQLVYSTWHYYQDRSDSLTYNAYANHFAQADAILQHEIIYGTDNPPAARFQLLYWVGFEALIVTQGTTHVLLAKMTIAAIVSTIALLSTYELARALGLSRSAAMFAVIAQAVLLINMEGRRSLGEGIFIRAILEDKLLGSFIISPVIFRLLFDYYKDTSPRNLFAFMLATLTFTFIHPTIFTFTAIIVGFLGIMRIIHKRQWRAAILTVIIMAICLLPLVSIRIKLIFTETPTAYTSTFEEREAVTGVDKTKANERIFFLEDTRFYSIHPDLLDDIAYLILYAACLLALLYPRDPLSQFLWASILLLLFLSFPYTAWIVGRFVTPNHIWRVIWLMPIGLAATFIMLKILHRWAILRRNTLLLGIFTGFFLIILFILPQKLIIMRYIENIPNKDHIQQLTDFISMANQLRDNDESIGMVVGDGEYEANLLPSIGLPTLYFRNAKNAVNHAAVSVDVGRHWADEWDKIRDDDTPVDEWLETVQHNNVTHIITKERDGLYGRFMDDLAPYIELLYHEGEYYLYRIEP